MQRNIKLFPFYKMFSYDVLFYYAISVLFLTGVKGLSLSQFALISSIYSLAGIISQFPASIITDRIGLRNSMIIGNLLCVTWGLLYLVSSSFTFFIVAECLSAFGFALKGASESPFLYSSLKREGELSTFGKVEGKGSTLYFIFEAVACIVAGYLYSINVYLPILFSCSCFLIATILAFYCKTIKSSSESLTPSEHFDEIKTGFKFIFKSKRLHALLIFASIFHGILIISSIYMKSFLNELNISSTWFGYLFAVLSIASAIGSTIQDKIEKHHRNKTLTTISLTYILSFVFLGIFTMITKDIKSLLIIGSLVFILQAVIKGAYRIIIKQYVSRYTTSAIRSKLMSVYYLAESFGSALLVYIVSITIDLSSIGIIYVVSGLILCIILILVFNYMISRVGLSPEQYGESDRIDLDKA